MSWPALPYESWKATCETLHAHTQVLGKLAATLAPPEPQLQHAALRLSARGWETLPLPAPDGSGAFAVALDLHAHEAIAEHSDGRVRRVPLMPDRAVGAVTRDVLAAVGELAGPSRSTPRRRRSTGRSRSTRTPSTRRTIPIRSPRSSRATRAATVLAALARRIAGARRPSTPGGDRSTSPSTCSPASGRPSVAGLHHAQRDGRHGDRRRLVARQRALPASGVLRVCPSGVTGLPAATLPAGRWDGALGEYVLDWTSAALPIRTTRSWRSPCRSCDTRAPSASDPAWPGACGDLRRRSTERGGINGSRGRRRQGTPGPEALAEGIHLRERRRRVELPDAATARRKARSAAGQMSCRRR